MYASPFDIEKWMHVLHKLLVTKLIKDPPSLSFLYKIGLLWNKEQIFRHLLAHSLTLPRLCLLISDHYVNLFSFRTPMTRTSLIHPILGTDYQWRALTNRDRRIRPPPPPHTHQPTHPHPHPRTYNNRSLEIPPWVIKMKISPLKPIFHQNPFALGRRLASILCYGLLVSKKPHGPNANPNQSNANPNQHNVSPNGSGGIWSCWLTFVLGFASGM